MKSGKRLLFLTAVLAVFIAGALLLKNYYVEKKAAETKTNGKPVVLALNKDDLREISYTNEEQTLRFAKGKDHWQYIDDPAFPLKESMVTSMADLLSNLTASRKVADTLDEAEQYGLTEPSITVTASTGDGKTSTLYFGNKNTAAGGTYLYLDGRQTVYTVSSSVVSKFGNKLYGLITDEAFPVIDASAVLKLQFQAPDRSLALKNFPKGNYASYSSLYTWFISDENGTLKPLESQKVNTYLTGVTGITTSETADYHVTEEELAAYGLDAPPAVITVVYTASRQETAPKANEIALPEVTPDASASTPADVLPSATPEGAAAAGAVPSPTPEMETITDSEQITISLGKETGTGSYYMRHSGSTRVFVISGDTYVKLANLNEESLRPSQFCLVPIDTVDGLTVTMDGKTTDLIVSRTKSADADGKTTTETTYKMGEAEASETTFKSLYTAVIGLVREQTTDDVPTGQPYMTVTFHRNTASFQEMVLTLYPYDSSFYLAEFFGESGLLVNKRDIEKLVAAYQTLLGS